MGCSSKPKPAENTSVKKVESKNSLPGTVRGKGWKIRWMTQDPKDRQKQVPLLIAKSETGELFYQGNIPNLRMKQVQAQLFQDGIMSATLEAGALEANRKSRRLIATKGVRVNNLIAPNVLKVTADKITWDTKTHSALAEGSAHLERPATTKTPKITSQAPKIWLDTKTGDMRIMGGNE
jgi:lipopolysaccharide assembly outer membrane protein LptD (OstA)